MKIYFVYLSTYFISGLSPVFPAPVSVSTSNNENTICPGPPKPDLNCLLFGEAGCQISCNVMCDFYGCQSSGTCLDQLYCDCQEILEVSSSTITLDDYHNLSLDSLWYTKFEKSSSSDKILDRIQSNSEISEKFSELLKNPHNTGEIVKSELLKSYPKWIRVKDLEPKRMGHVQDFTEEENFDYDSFNQYLEDTLNPLLDEAAERLKKIKYRKRMLELLSKISDDDLQYIIRQIFSSANESLLNYMRNYLEKNGYDLDDIINFSGIDEESAFMNDIDLFIQKHVVKKLIDYKDTLNMATEKSSPSSLQNDNLLTKKQNKVSLKSKNNLKDETYDEIPVTEIETNKKSKKPKTNIKNVNISLSEDRLNDADYNSQITIKKKASISQLPEENTLPIKKSKVKFNSPPDGIYDGNLSDEIISPVKKKIRKEKSNKTSDKKSSINWEEIDEIRNYNFNEDNNEYETYNNNNNGKFNSDSDYNYSGIYGICCNGQNLNYYGTVYNDDGVEGGNYFDGSDDRSGGYYGNGGSRGGGGGGYYGGGGKGGWGGFYRNWDLGNSGIAVANDGRGNNLQSWNLGSSGVNVVTDAWGNTGKQWKLGKSSISSFDEGYDDSWNNEFSVWNYIKKGYKKLLNDFNY